MAYQRYLKTIHLSDLFSRYLVAITKTSTDFGHCFSRNNRPQTLKPAREILQKALESLSLEDNEQIISLDVNSLYTKVPIGEAIQIALRELYSRKLAPEMPRPAIKNYEGQR